MPCRGTLDGCIMVDSSDKTWSSEEGNGKPFQYSCLETPMSSMKRQKRLTLKGELPGFVGTHMQLKISGEMTPERMKRQKPKQKQHPVVDVTGDGSKVRCCKEQYCRGTWNVRSMNRGKLKVVKQEMARVTINILGISKLK